MANLQAARFCDVCDYKDIHDMNNDDTIKVRVGRIDMHKAEAQWLYEHGHYVVTSTMVFQMCYSVNAGYYGLRLHWNRNGNFYCKPGRFYTGDADFVNNILGFELVA